MAGADVTIPVVERSAVPAAGSMRAIWLLLAAAFVAILNETTMGVAIPHLIDDLGITAVAAQWMTTAFMLTMAVVIPITGFLLRRFTTRAMFFAAMGLFSAGTLLAFLAPGFPVLIAARVVQASGTAIMMPLLMTTLMTLVAPSARGRMMGRVTVVIAFAPALGPSIAGLILDTVGWRWIFGLVLPFALTALAMGARWLPNVGDTTTVRIDALSVVLSALGFGGVVYGLSELGAGASAGQGGDAAFTTTIVVASFTVGAAALGLFVWRQLRLQRRDAALLDMRVFRSANFSLSVAQFGVMSLAFFGVITILPLYLQDAVGLTALQSGLAVLPGSLAMGLSGPLIGRIYDRYGTRVLLVPGAVILTVMLFVLANVSLSTPYWMLVVIQTLLSVGLAMSFTPLFTASLGSVAPTFYSYASAVVSTVQQVAGAAGVALLVTILTVVSASGGGTADPGAVAAGTRVAFLVAAFVSLPLIVGAFLIRKPADTIDAPAAH